MHAHCLQGDRQQTRRHLFARRHDRVILARVVQRRGLARPADKLVGLAGHGRHHHRNLVTGIDLAFDMAGHDADAIDVGDGRPAEFHHDTRHESVEPCSGMRPAACGRI